MEQKRLDPHALEVTTFEVDAPREAEDFTLRTQCSKCQWTD